MRLYYDPVTEDALYTIIGDDANGPPGDFILVPDSQPTSLAGAKVQNGQLVQTDLSDIKAQAIARINNRAGDLRRSFITSIPGQEMLYLAKEEEARAWVADPSPTISAYPLIAAEAGLTAPDADQLAQLWLNLGALWRATAAQIETARLGAVYSIEAATSETEIAAIEAAYEGALP